MVFLFGPYVVPTCSACSHNAWSASGPGCLFPVWSLTSWHLFLPGLYQGPYTCCRPTVVGQVPQVPTWSLCGLYVSLCGPYFTPTRCMLPTWSCADWSLLGCYLVSSYLARLVLTWYLWSLWWSPFSPTRSIGKDPEVLDSAPPLAESWLRAIPFKGLQCNAGFTQY